MNTPKRTGKQQQKCFDILVEFLVLDVDWAFATALWRWRIERDEELGY